MEKQPEFTSPWHDPDKELPPTDTTVIVVIPLPSDFRKYGITDTVRPSPGNRDPPCLLRQVWLRRTSFHSRSLGIQTRLPEVAIT